MYSVIIPVYRNAEFVPDLISEFSRISRIIRERFQLETEFVFVVDASPDDSFELLEKGLAHAPFRSQLILHARNFGSFAAIRTGLRAAHGDFFGVIAADLQEPPELLIEFLDRLYSDAADIVVGVREGRDDPPLSRLSANIFWSAYRRLIVRDIPAGGVDVFGCNRRIRDELLTLEEANSSLVGLVYWLGFRRTEVQYRRRARAYGKSAWTLSKKITYLLDSIFAFTDLPIRILTILGVIGIVAAAVLAVSVIILRLIGEIEIAGYTTTIVVITFFGALNTLGLGLIGAYAWRAYENTKRRPLALVRTARVFAGTNVPSLSEVRSVQS
ncbi:glycosyltransferase family 2 protein [Microvirga subterranea]|uniref:Glycosyltransferase involved in cell wall biosynthesis n=1 Tax=Microvirga subterranea TaxID=186651 RepID=A0A370HKE2_9HYPH|nr:glycosyltransferase family 2 protein [Microvirga subterranea]RDI58541.1 glycosyltransferase involved in cell wall biosynthesis [Microvirga subterranea]